MDILWAPKLLKEGGLKRCESRMSSSNQKLISARHRALGFEPFRYNFLGQIHLQMSPPKTHRSNQPMTYLFELVRSKQCKRTCSWFKSERMRFVGRTTGFDTLCSKSHYFSSIINRLPYIYSHNHSLKSKISSHFFLSSPIELSLEFLLPIFWILVSHYK